MKTSSFWWNWVVSVGLFSLIAITYHFGMKTPEETPVSAEEQIVLEDHSSDTPLEEAETITMPTPAPKPEEKIDQPKTREERTVKTVIPDYKKPDPYTSGGPLDLDKQYLSYRVTDKNGDAEVREVSRTAPDQRDYFIPFEQD